MAYIAVEVDGVEVSRREGTFGDDSFSQQVSDTLAGKNMREFEKSSRQRRKEAGDAN